MTATRWEFENRAWILGAIFGVSFFLSPIDRRNTAVAIAGPIAAWLKVDGDAAVRAVFALGALLAALGAATRTWASAYLAADIVYAEQLKTASLVADGPYRFVRNPLYFGNVLLAIGMGTMASRFGFVLLNVLMLLFSYRLILREEGELAAAQGAGYDAYRSRVPRLFPSPVPRIPSAGRPPRWAKAFLAESWY
jgi:protein-S-isoprenylcysteine O-methyltransferase Ste14